VPGRVAHKSKAGAEKKSSRAAYVGGHFDESEFLLLEAMESERILAAIVRGCYFGDGMISHLA
jgi:hypothetical protein